MFEAFISYSRKDKAFVQKLYTTLTQQDRKIWVDWEDIPLTADWRQEIYDGIDAANNFIFILSHDSITSSVCREELERAINNNKRIVPIVHRDVAADKVHPELAKLNWIFFRETDDFDKAFQSLTTALDTDLAHVKTHTRLLTRAIEWDHKGQEGSLLLRGNDLRSAEHWLEQETNKFPAPTPLQRMYVGQSRRLETARQRKLLVGVTTGAVISTILAIVAGIGWNEANRQRVVAEQQLLSAESGSAQLLSSTGQGFDALLTSLKAGIQLRQASWRKDNNSLATRIVNTLQEAVYGAREQNRLIGHSDVVYSVSFSPDGQTIASASGDHTIKLWNLDGSLRQTLKGHENKVHQIEFSPDGKTLASASADGMVKLWNPDGTFRQVLAGHTNAVYSVAFSPDSQLIASASADGTIKLWAQDGTLLQTLSGQGKVSQPMSHGRHTNSHHDPRSAKSAGEVRYVSFSPDGRTLAAASGNTIQLWSRTGKLLKTITGYNRPVLSVNFSPTGRMLVVASEDGTIQLWKPDGTSVAKHFEGNVVLQAKFSPDGKTIASAGGDTTVKLWNLDNTLLQTFQGHQDGVYGISFSPNSQTIASASADGTVRLWQRNGISLQTLQSHDGDVYSVVFSPDGQIMASGSADNDLKLWQRDGKLIKTLKGHSDLIHSVAFSPDSQTLASASWDGTAKLWTRDGTLIRTLKGHVGRVYGIGFSPDGKMVVTSSGDGTIKLWARNGKLMKTLRGHTDVVHNVSFSSDGQFMVSASHDKTVRLWSRDGRMIRILKGHTNWIHAVTFSPDGQTIASASHDRTVKLWSRDGRLLRTLEGNTDKVLGVTFSPDNQMIASSGADKTVRLWRTDGTPIAILRGHGDGIHGINFSPDGKTLSSASDDHTVILWNLENLNDLDGLLTKSCDWLRGYLRNNPTVPNDDLTLCDGIRPAVK